MDCNKINLKKGSKGTDVKELQRYLKQLGLYNGVVNGDYGVLTEQAVRKLQAKQGNSVDGHFGPKTCSKSGLNTSPTNTTGLHTLSLAQYLEMWNRIGRWQNKNKTTRLPNYVDISDMKVGVNKVYKAQFLDMLKRMQNWIDTHNGAMAQVIGIEGAASGTEPQKVGNIQSKLERGLGTFNSFTDFWKKILGRGYSKYFNDVYTLEQEITRLINKQGLNCTDIMQLCYQLGVEMGYQMRYVHVICTSGTGHIRGQIKGREFKDWTRIDPAAALSTSSKYPFGRVWCDLPNAGVSTEKWLMSDDGKT